MYGQYIFYKRKESMWKTDGSEDRGNPKIETY